tara:strand:- start:332 stop:1567 length:1236 start_codon:yes stop_codon:yes gene_type:complete
MYTKIYNLTFINDIINDSNFNNKFQKKEWDINNINYSFNVKYYILKYIRSLLNVDNYHDIGLLRSIVLKDNKIICFSPVKSLNYEYFISYYNANTCIAEEYVEGTMINLFYDYELNNWQISTKSSVGGNVKFLKNQKNFSDLFNDICNELNIDLNYFSRDYCYSFVMQHPDNQFVMSISVKKLYLIAIYQIDSINYIVKEIPKTEYSNLNLPNNLSYPFAHYFDSYENLLNYYASVNTPINIMGIVIKNVNGDRTKIRNPNYNYVKNLKGNNTKLQYHYLELYKNNKINEYLQYFPNKIQEFNCYKKILYDYTETLYLNYISCFIKKEKLLHEFPFQYKNHMYLLHQEYIKNKSENSDSKFFINKKFIINYIKNLETPRLMFSLNYHLKNINNNNKNNDIILDDVNENIID